jgi:putative ABC transport system substrate-binding protein
MGGIMKRRTFLALLSCAASAPPRVALAQVSQVRHIGVLLPYVESDPEAQAEVASFKRGLQQLGWTDGGNARIDVRWATGGLERIRMSAKALVADKPDVILCRATPVTLALQKESTSIPIVFVNVSDPVGSGFAASVARPGSNLTGFTNVEASLGGKWVEILKEINPRIARIAVVFDPRTSPGGGSFYMHLIQDAARSIAAEVVAAPFHDDADIARVMESFARLPNGGVVVLPDTATNNHRKSIIEQVARFRLPAVYPYRFLAAEGGLASYGIDVVDAYRQAAGYVDRILRGEKPGELPVQGPVKFELAINHKTAKALGLELSPMLLGRADDVIE